MLHKFFCLASAFFVYLHCASQNVGIGTTTPNASAQLEIQSATKGLLLPKISIGNVKLAAPVTAPATGLLVYNTNTAISGGEGEGFYYWNGTEWINLKTASNAWGTNGNGYTGPGIPVLGTRNNMPILVLMNNQKSAYLDSFNTHYGFRAANNYTTGKNNVAIGRNALELNEDKSKLVAVGDSALYSNGLGAADVSQGEQNTAVGYRALKNNTLGSYNTSLGYSTLFRNTTGFDNTAVGTSALGSNTTGTNNVAVGSFSMLTSTLSKRCIGIGAYTLIYNRRDDIIAIGDSALLNNSFFLSDVNLGINNLAIGSKALFGNIAGNNNLAIGREALLNNVSGNNNLALGYHSGFFNSGSGNLFLGNNAGANARSSNKLYIENSEADSTAALIYGDFSADSLSLNAKVNIRDYTRLGTQASGAPAIKMKKIFIPSGPAVNGVQGYALGSGITDSKVIGVQVTLAYSGQWKIPPSYIDTPGYEYNIQIQNNNLVIVLKNGSSANIGSKPITALITYEE
ncbi:MAG: hypothetical protein IPP72_13575 [Chitinophagaceae bacterium]|nr:hypothetical protein [Chitinophagaceae bacterium]